MALRKPAKAGIPPGYQPLGPSTTTERAASSVRLDTGSATVEVTALAPDLFRVGFFPQGRAVDYSSFAAVSRDWQPGRGTILETAEKVPVATPAATRHHSP